MSGLQTDAQVSWLFARIARLLEKIREAFRGARTAEDVFRAIRNGRRTGGGFRNGWSG